MYIVGGDTPTLTHRFLTVIKRLLGTCRRCYKTGLWGAWFKTWEVTL